jgi:Skp family chaperone for outer membrane proteins
MKTMLKAALLGFASFTTAVALPQVAAAQATGNVGVADLEQALQQSNAFVLAVNQIKVSYKPQLDAFEAKRVSLEGALKPKVDAFEAARKVPGANQAALQVQLTALQKAKQDGDRELAVAYAPVNRVTQFVQEQIGAKMEDALKAAMRKKGVGIVMSPNPQVTISYTPAADITAEIIAELNTLVPSVGITPPAGWQPGQGGARPAATPAAPGSPARPAPTKPAPQGR